MRSVPVRLLFASTLFARSYPDLQSNYRNSASMSSNDDLDRSRDTASSGENVPYTITEEDGKIKVVFTSGPQQGDNFEIRKPQTVGIGEGSRTKQAEAEPSPSVSYLDGNGNEISEEEFERLSAAEIAEEGRRERASGMRQGERGT
jgi:hypothetical protein